MKQGKKKIEDQRTLSPPSGNGSEGNNEEIIEDDSLKELNLRVPRQVRKSKEEQSSEQSSPPQNEEISQTTEKDGNQSNNEANMRLLSATELLPPEEVSPVKKKSGLLSKKRMSVIDECLDQIRSRRDLIAARLLTGASFELDEDILDSSDASITRENSVENIPKQLEKELSQDQQQNSLKDQGMKSSKKQVSNLKSNTGDRSQNNNNNNIQIIINEDNTHSISSKNSKEDVQTTGGLQEQKLNIGNEKEMALDNNITTKQSISIEKKIENENENESKNSIRPGVITVEKLDSVLNGSTSPFSKNLQDTTGNNTSNTTKPNNNSPTKTTNNISKASQMSQSKSIRSTTRAFGQGSKMNSMKSSIYQNLGQGTTSSQFGAGSQSQFKMSSGECFEGFRDRQLAHQLAKMEEEEEKSVVRQLERLTEAMRVDKEAYLQQAVQRRVNTKDFFKQNNNTNQVTQNNNNNISQHTNKKIETNNKLQVDSSTGGGGWLDHSNDIANINSLTMIVHEAKEDEYEDLDVGELLSRFEAEFQMKKDTIDPKLSEFLQGSMRLSSMNVSGGGTNQSVSQNIALTEEEQEKQKQLNELAEKIKYKSYTKLGIVLNKQKKDLKKLDLECLQGIVELSILTEERTKREVERREIEELQRLESIKQRRQGLEKKQKNLSSEDEEEEYNKRRLERKEKNNIRFGGDDAEGRDNSENILPDDIDQVNLQWSDLAQQHENLKLQLTKVQDQFKKNKQELTQELVELQCKSKDNLNIDSTSKNTIYEQILRQNDTNDNKQTRQQNRNGSQQSNSKLQNKRAQDETQQQQNSQARYFKILFKKVQLKSFKNSLKRLSFQNALQKIDLRINARTEKLIMKKEQLYGELTELKELFSQLRGINLIVMNERIKELQQEIDSLRVQLVNNQHTQTYIKDTYETQIKQREVNDNSDGNNIEQYNNNSNDIFYSSQENQYENNRSFYQTNHENTYATLDDPVQLENKLSKLISKNAIIEGSIEKMVTHSVQMQHMLDQQYYRNQYY